MQTRQQCQRNTGKCKLAGICANDNALVIVKNACYEGPLTLHFIIYSTTSRYIQIYCLNATLSPTLLHHHHHTLPLHYFHTHQHHYTLAQCTMIIAGSLLGGESSTCCQETTTPSTKTSTHGSLNTYNVGFTSVLLPSIVRALKYRYLEVNSTYLLSFIIERFRTSILIAMQIYTK